MKKWRIGVFILAILVVILVAVAVAVRYFTASFRQQASDKISVTTSFYPLFFFATEIGGARVDVRNITPVGVEPHDYEPTARDIAQIEKSAILILNGGGLEPWSDNIRQNIDTRRTRIVTAGEGLFTGRDPHVWLGPLLAQKMVDAITRSFVEVDQAHADSYQVNASALKEKLNNLDNLYRQGLENCKQKSIITSHAAFGYLAAAYGLREIPITGLSPDEEPSSQQLAGIVAFAKSNKITHIFFESLASPKLSETVASEVGAQTLALNPLEGLSDEERAQGKDYFTEMKSNLTNLQIALACTQ